MLGGSLGFLPDCVEFFQVIFPTGSSGMIESTLLPSQLALDVMHNPGVSFLLEENLKGMWQSMHSDNPSRNSTQSSSMVESVLEEIFWLSSLTLSFKPFRSALWYRYNFLGLGLLYFGLVSILIIAIPL